MAQFLLCLTLLPGTGIRAAPVVAPSPAPEVRPLTDILVDEWNNRDGLRQLTIQTIVQDSRGYLWLGTQAGVVQFDGLGFHFFGLKEVPEIASTDVPALAVLPDDTVMVGSSQGLSTLRNGKGRTIKVTPRLERVGLPVRSMIQCARRDEVWVATAVGLYKGNANGVQRVGAEDPDVYSVSCVDGQVAVGVRGGVRVPDGQAWRTIALPEARRDASVLAVRKVSGVLWVATSLGLWQWSENRWRMVQGHNLGPQSAVTALQPQVEGHTSMMWVGANTGLSRVMGTGVEAFPVQGPMSISLVRSLWVGQENSLWVGTQVNGLYKLFPRWVDVFPMEVPGHDVIMWSMVRQASGRGLWVGSTEGVYAFENGHFQVLVPSSELPHPHAYNLLTERDRLWIGTRTGLVYVNHPVAGQRGKPVRDPVFEPLARSQINAFVRDPDGPLWIGSSSGLWRFDGTKLIAYGKKEGIPNGIGILFLRQLKSGDVLAGTTHGAFRRTHGQNAFVQMPVLNRDGSAPEITSIEELPSGAVAFGARDGRVYFLDKGKLVTTAQAAPLANSAPFFMHAENGFLWINGLNGISRTSLPAIDRLLKGQTASLDSVTVMSTPQDHHSLDQGGCCNGLGTSRGVFANGALYAPGRNSVVQHRLGIESQQPSRAPVAVIERVAIENISYALEDAPHGALPRGARDIEFNFNLISLKDPPRNTVRYRLVGYDTDWQEAGMGVRSVRYTNLPVGKYRFEVLGRNADGIAAKYTAIYNFEIPPLLHETWWFRLAMAAFALLFVLLWWRWRARRSVERQHALEHLVDERTAALEHAYFELEKQNVTDALTGLHNRKYVSQAFPQYMARVDGTWSGRDGNAPRALFCVLDIDNFKCINDHYGHEGGDRLLQSFADLLKRQVRANDHLVRWGGEEFVLVLGITSDEAVRPLLDRMLAAVRNEQHDIGDGVCLSVTCSIGAVEFPRFTGDWSALIALADRALYKVKNDERNGWALLRPLGVSRLDAHAVCYDLNESIAYKQVTLERESLPQRADDPPFSSN